MGINRPSLYAAFGNKEAAVSQGSRSIRDGSDRLRWTALAEPTARKVVERLFAGGIDLVTDPARTLADVWRFMPLWFAEIPLIQFVETRAARRKAMEIALCANGSSAKDEGDSAPAAEPADFVCYAVTVSAWYGSASGWRCHAERIGELAQMAPRLANMMNDRERS